MKIFRNLVKLSLPTDQDYFLSCWYNMVHARSLDSHRARVMNPENTLKELLKILDRGKALERSSVFEEARNLMEADPILHREKYRFAIVRMRELLKIPALLKEDDSGPASTMLRYLMTEVNSHLSANYVEDCLHELTQILIHGSRASEDESERFKVIKIITSNLLSTLIFRGWSLESLHDICVQISRGISPKREFSRQWNFITLIITRPPREYQVLISLDQVTVRDEFPSNIGNISFSKDPQILVPDRLLGEKADAVRQYLLTSNKRLFASLNVFSSDERSAGTNAVQRLNDILNLVRFEYERARVTIPDSFVIRFNGQPARLENLPFAVPNPSAAINGASLEAFVKAVDDLVTNDNFDSEGFDRVYAAFRLYRTGLDTSVLENKFTNWWTAIEYLVRGSTSDAGIGNAVENFISPVLGVSYLSKHLIAYRAMLLDLKIQITDPTTQLPMEMASMSTLGLYHLFKRVDIQPLIYSALAKYPYALAHIKQFFIDLSTPQALFKFNEAHEKRVKWQLQRLWRSRCDIVHSADRQVGLVLLCANLEYYLKITLVSLLNEVRHLPTLSGPKEFFDRQQHKFIELQDALRSGSDAVLIRLLDREVA